MPVTAQATATLRDPPTGTLAYLQQRVRELESQVWQTSTDKHSSASDVLSPGHADTSITVLPAAYSAAGSPGPSPQPDATALDSEDEDDDTGVDASHGSNDALDDGKQPPETSDTVLKDAASILEFLAWGRRKDPEYHPSGQRPVGTAARAVPMDAVASSGATGDNACGPPATADCPTLPMPPPRISGTATFGGDDLQSGDSRLLKDSGSLQNQPLAVIQLLLPSRWQVEQLAHYHIEYLLWHHASFLAPQFRADLAAFYEKHNGSIERSTPTGAGVDLQWAALLFAVLAGSLTCAPDQQALAWGFGEPERQSLCKHWFQASLECLHRDQYMANHSIFSCQAIATMTTSAHILGLSNTQSIQLAVAVRIAQSLGLHRLDAQGGMPSDAEVGRRVWNQLCTQDWFGIPFSESYLVNPLHSKSCTLANCHDDDLATPLPAHEPTVSGFSRFLNNIASIMPRLHDSLLSCNTAYTRYQQVLAWDAHMRTLATAERPHFLSSQVALQPHWPCWVPWARRSLAISSGHKIIMIHRSFLSESFTNPAFAFTRHTCIAASKTIINQYKAVQLEDSPVLWTHQAFAVSASIILLLDVLHRRPGEEWQHVPHKQLVEDVVGILQKFPGSMIAVRGVKLLRALLDEVAAAQESHDTTSKASQHTSRKRKRQGPSPLPREDAPTASPLGNQPSFSVPEFIRRYCQSETTGGTRQVHRRNQQRQPRQTAQNRPPGRPRFGGAQTNAAREEAPGGDSSSVRSPAAVHGYANPMGFEPLSEGFTAQSDDAVQSGGLEEPGQLDMSMVLPLGWDSASNGFENLLYLVNHDLIPP